MPNPEGSRPLVRTTFVVPHMRGGMGSFVLTAMLRFSMVVSLIAIALCTKVSAGGSVGYCPV